MSYCGQAAIDFLATQIRADDPGASSHWRHFHRDFEFRDDGTFAGLDGFGTCTPPLRGVRGIVHQTLQRRYRRMGRRYAGFGRIDRIASSIVERQSRAYDLDVLRQAVTLAFLEHHLPQQLGKHAVVAVIGDGFASMTTLLLASGLAKQVVLVNLNKTLLVDLAFLRRWGGEDPAYSFTLAVDVPDFVRTNGGDDASVLAVQASHHDLLREARLDLAINIASMQEMDPSAIEGYFTDLRAAASHKPLHFYCCNREEKRLPDGVVTRFGDYPWSPADEIMLDELCPWHQQYYSTRPPFYRNYDGPIRHRLVRLSPAH